MVKNLPSQVHVPEDWECKRCSSDKSNANFGVAKKSYRGKKYKYIDKVCSKCRGEDKLAIKAKIKGMVIPIREQISNYFKENYNVK